MKMMKLDPKNAPKVVILHRQLGLNPQSYPLPRTSFYPIDCIEKNKTFTHSSFIPLFPPFGPIST